MFSEMAQWGKALATKFDNLSLIPRTYMVLGENPFFQLSSDLQMCSQTHTQTHTRIHGFILFF